MTCRMGAVPSLPSRMPTRRRSLAPTNRAPRLRCAMPGLPATKWPGIAGMGWCPRSALVGTRLATGGPFGRCGRRIRWRGQNERRGKRRRGRGKVWTGGWADGNLRRSGLPGGMVDAADLKSAAFGRTGSSPVVGIALKNKE